MKFRLLSLFRKKRQADAQTAPDDSLIPAGDIERTFQTLEIRVAGMSPSPSSRRNMREFRPPMQSSRAAGHSDHR